MERMLVVIFDSDDKARRAARVLEVLKDLSLIGLNADAIVTKDLEGETTIMHSHPADPQGTMGGMAFGSLVGLFGGPVGLVVGGLTGALVGASADLLRARVGSDFVTEVAAALEAGKTALVANIDEEDTDQIDRRMADLGGVVFRRDLLDVEDAAYEREVAAMEANAYRTRSEYAREHAARKRRVRARVDSLKRKLKL